MSSFYCYNTNDFIVIYSTNSFDYVPDNYTIISLYHTQIYFKKYDNLPNNYKINLEGKNKYIQFINTLFPIFIYQSDSCQIITPNYSHLLEMKLSLSVDYSGIREFVLFHTPVDNRTFHKEVNRLFGVDKISFNQFQPNIHYQKKSKISENVLDMFIHNVDINIKTLQNCRYGVFLSGGGESRINAAITNSYGLDKEFINWGHPKDKEYLIADKIAKKLNTPLHNIRPDCSCLPYEELLSQCGYLVNMQYAYRYAAVKHLFERLSFDLVWTGWGDINGYPTRYQPSELFSAYYLGLYSGEKRYPPGWNHDWLKDHNDTGNWLLEQIKADPSPRTFFDLKENLFAPAIFGQVLAIENLVGRVFAPWFSPDLYAAVCCAEKQNHKLINSKLHRVLWKNELYYQLIKKYCPELNHIKNARGYYPWLLRARMGAPGLLVAAVLKKISSRRRYPFDPVEDRVFIKKELSRIVDEGNDLFDREAIKNIIKNVHSWSGPDILEYFKMIQSHWFLKTRSCI